ncbi:MAG: MATE family efflux transporter [Ruthenibacterium sp.]
MESIAKRHFIFEKTFYKTVLAIAVPIALQNMISFGVAMMDSVMLGSLGDIAISAANLGTQPFSILMSCGFGLSSGGSVLIAQYWGKHDLNSIRKVMRISMQIVFVISTIVTVVCVLFPTPIMRLFSGDEKVVQAAASYLGLCAFSYVPYSLANNYMTSLRAVESVNVSTWIYVVSFFVNVFFNYIFIFGKFGAPVMGVRGAAVGTILARCSELLLVLIYMYGWEHRTGFRIHKCFRFSTQLLPSYIRHALPVVGNEMLWGIGFVVTTAIIGRIGSVFVAANSITSVLNQLAFVSIAGVANAAAVLTGKTIGEGDRDRAQRVANTLVALSFLVGLFNCVMILLLRGPFLGLYKVTPETHAAAYSIMTVLALLQLIMGVDVTCIVGVLRGGGDTRSAFIYDCGSMWLLSLPLGILAGLVWKLPVPLVYAILKIDSPVKAILSLGRIRGGRWIRNVTVQTARPVSDETPAQQNLPRA